MPLTIPFTGPSFDDLAYTRLGGIPQAPIVCLGDSLTYGETDGAQVNEPFPLALSSILGRPVVNKGTQGYIPRHRVYDFLITDAPTVLKSDLLAIPPTQYEDRINQPETNNLRTFYTNGQQKWVHTGTPSESTAKLYQYSSSSTATPDDDTVLMPSWVGTSVNNPAYTTGRWLLQSGTFTPTANGNLLNGDIVFWLGANGMEAADTVAAARMLLRNRGPRVGRFLALTLANRQPYNADSGDIADWAEWTGAVNAALIAAFPGQIVDIAGYFLGAGDTGTFGAFPVADSKDTADIAHGVLPRSIKDGSGTGTHLNQTGYSYVAAVVANALGAAPGRVAIALKTVVRCYGPHAPGARAVDLNQSLVALANHTNLQTATQFRRISGSSAPTLEAVQGYPVVRHTATGQTLACSYAADQPGPNTLFFIFKIDTLPTTRGDLLDADSLTPENGRRCLVNVLDYSGTKRFNTYATQNADTGVVADTNWHSLVVVFNGSSSYLYLDGAKSSAFNPGTGALAGLRVGNPNQPLAFRWTEVGHYNAAASDAWVAAYHAAALKRFAALLNP